MGQQCATWNDKTGRIPTFSATMGTQRCLQSVPIPHVPPLLFSSFCLCLRIYLFDMGPPLSLRPLLVLQFVSTSALLSSASPCLVHELKTHTEYWRADTTWKRPSENADSERETPDGLASHVEKRSKERTRKRTSQGNKTGTNWLPQWAAGQRHRNERAATRRFLAHADHRLDN